MTAARISGLSPEAHGTLAALRQLQEIKHVEEGVERELIAHSLAERVDSRLRLTKKGRKLSLRAASVTKS